MYVPSHYTHRRRKEEGMGCARFMFYVYCLILSTDALVVGIAGRDILTAILDLNHQAAILIRKALVLNSFITVIECSGRLLLRGRKICFDIPIKSYTRSVVITTDDTRLYVFY